MRLPGGLLSFSFRLCRASIGHEERKASTRRSRRTSLETARNEAWSAVTARARHAGCVENLRMQET
jgi:hypothetical protein